MILKILILTACNCFWFWYLATTKERLDEESKMRRLRLNRRRDTTPGVVRSDTLKMVDVDECADELATWCNKCGDNTGLIAPNGKVITGRWQ